MTNYSVLASKIRLMCIPLLKRDCPEKRFSDFFFKIKQRNTHVKWNLRRKSTVQNWWTKPGLLRLKKVARSPRIFPYFSGILQALRLCRSEFESHLPRTYHFKYCDVAEHIIMATALDIYLVNEWIHTVGFQGWGIF